MAKKKTPAPAGHTTQEAMQRRVTELIGARMIRMRVVTVGTTAFARARFTAASDVMAGALHRLNEAAGFGVAALEALTDAGVELDRCLGRRSKKPAAKKAKRK